ncbi:MAG: hypothetical protein R3C10_18375 [Pirellulales bacterium]
MSVVAILPALVVPSATAHAQQVGRVPGRQPVPSSTYYAVLREHYEGEFRDSLGDFNREVRGCIKIGSLPFIDSICYHAMTGEAFYQLGRTADALEHYNIALRVFAQYSDWMIRVRFEANVRPLPPTSMVRVTWGQSTRDTTVGNFRSTPLMERGRLSNNDQVQRGGVVQNPYMHPVDAAEVVLHVRRSPCGGATNCWESLPLKTI